MVEPQLLLVARVFEFTSTSVATACALNWGSPALAVIKAGKGVPGRGHLYVEGQLVE